MELNLLYVWLITGVVFFIAEAIGVNGFGLLFAGFGAFSIGLLLNFGIVGLDNIVGQLVIFFAATALWAVLLWKPLKKYLPSKNQQTYHNIVGKTAIVGEKGLDKQHGGEVIWSGTIMKAELAENEHHKRLEAGVQVVITDISGIVLIVTKKI